MLSDRAVLCLGFTRMKHRTMTSVSCLWIATIWVACVPDLDSLSGGSISSGAGGDASDAGGGTSGSSGDTSGIGGASGSAGTSGNGGSSGMAGAGGSGQPTPQVRYDFEESGTRGMDGWIAVGDQRPPDVQDTVEQSADAAHNGTGALRAVFDGQASVPDAGEGNPWYGVYKVGTIPTDYEVNLWMMATMPGVTAEIYAQTTQAYLWNVLGSENLAEGEWTQLSFIAPPDVMQWGIKLLSPFDAQGYVYLDEVSW